MKAASLCQTSKILSIFYGLSSERVQAILESGFLADIRDAKVEAVNREQLRKVLGLKPINFVRDWPVWKTIRLGTGLKAADDFQHALKNKGCSISDMANHIISKLEFSTSISPVAKEVDLCVATTEDLICRDGTTADIYAGIKKIGGELLTAEVGPQLRLQYLDQPKGEKLFVAMEPIEGPASHPGVWYIERDDSDLWLLAHCIYPNSIWSEGRKWVFARRK